MRIFLSCSIIHKTISASSISLASCGSIISGGCDGGGGGGGGGSSGRGGGGGGGRGGGYGGVVAVAAVAVAEAIAVTSTDLVPFRPRYLNFSDVVFTIAFNLY